SRPRVNNTRFRRSGTLNTLATASKNFINPRLSGLRPDDLGGASCGLNLVERRLREHVGLNRNFTLQFARTQNLETAIFQLPENTQFHQAARIEAVALQRFQPTNIHDRVFLAEDIGETPLRQAPVEGHLAAFESAHT